MVDVFRFVAKMNIGVLSVYIIGTAFKFFPTFYNWFVIITTLLLVVILFLANYNDELAPLFSLLFLAGLIGLVASLF